MPYADDFHRSELLERICESARFRLGEEQAAAMAPYLHHYYARVGLHEIAAKGADALFGAAFAHWRFGERRLGGTALVRVYNPSLDEHGWRSEHSVVEIVTDDMPFLVDSVTAELNRRDLTVDLIVHPVLRVRRDEHGQLLALLEPGAPADEGWAESFMHIEVTRQPDRALQAIADGIGSVLADVRAAVGDWFEMRGALDRVIGHLGGPPARTVIPEAELAESRAFLNGSGARISPSWVIESTTSCGKARTAWRGSRPAVSACYASPVFWSGTICAMARRYRRPSPIS